MVAKLNENNPHKPHKPFCNLGMKKAFTKDNPLIIGNDCLIRPHSTIYGMNDISDGLTTGHYVSIRENSAIGTCCQIGSYSELQGDCVIEDYVKMQWMMLQQDEPEDFIIATGVQYSVKQFIEWTALESGISLTYEGEGTNEIAKVSVIVIVVQ